MLLQLLKSTNSWITLKEQQLRSCFYFKISPLESRYVLLLYIIVVLEHNKGDREVIETF